MNTAKAAAGALNGSVAHEIVAQSRTVLERLMRAPSGELFAAQLSHHPFDNDLDAISTHVVVYHIDGSTDVEKRVRGRVKGRRPRVGSITLIPGAVETGWRIGAPNRVAHLYVPQQHLETYCSDVLGLDRRPELRDFFDVNDPWLRAFFTLLLSEHDAGAEAEVEALLLDQLRHRLLRHLVESYTSIGRPRSDGADAPRMRAAALRRIFEFIDAQLCGEIRLKQLAAIACQSEDHFIRSFRATLGCTPYQYVLKRRIECAKGLLRDTELSISEVSGRAGFNSSCHFSSAFRRCVGCNPRSYRNEAKKP